jgi:beta-lactamase regulating signal transducer with metallopeptidase domain
MMMSGLIGVLFVLLIYGGMIAVAVFLLILLSRFVKASERMAGAAEEIARKLRDATKP